MRDRQLALYYAWSRPAETGAPLEVIENRFPALFESRRMLYPRFAEFADPERYAQGIAGFIDHILRTNFAAFVEQAAAQTGRPVIERQRVEDDGHSNLLDGDWMEQADTLVIISFDSLRTSQAASDGEVRAMQTFLATPGHLLAVCPHHDIGAVEHRPEPERAATQLAHFLHHGDRTIPPQQGFGGFARSLLSGLGVPVENRFGLRPATEADGSPSAVEARSESDRLQLLKGVATLNAHSHLPHFERMGDAIEKMEVLARQRVDRSAPPHPFLQDGRLSFDAMLQSRPGVFAGDLVVADTTIWSSTAGGIDSLRRLWANLLARPSSP